MQWRRRDVTITSQCVEAIFSLTGEDEAECIEGVENFKCMGRIIDRSYNIWLVVCRNVSNACQVWNRLGKI